MSGCFEDVASCVIYLACRESDFLVLQRYASLDVYPSLNVSADAVGVCCVL
jgi:hypothetical protein